MAGSTLVQLRVPDDLLARIDEACEGSTRTAWLLGLAVAELEDAGPDDDPFRPPELPADLPSGAVGILGPGVPSPGVVCFTPHCMQRNTAKYGLRELPLCTACAYAAGGVEYSRPQPQFPPSWRKKLRVEPEPEPEPV